MELKNHNIFIFSKKSIDCMTYPEGVIAVGSVLLTLMGGIAGNLFHVFVHRIRSHNRQNLNLYDYFLFFLMIVFLIIVLVPFFQLLLNSDISTNPGAFFLCLGILFGVIGSIYSNFFSAAYDRYLDSRITDHGYSNVDKRAMTLTGGVLLLFIAYLFWMFMTFK